MRRHSSIQLLLLSLTGCSWMLLFLTLTLSDYHAFKAYHASHVAAAHTTYTTPSKDVDPCDLCWGIGKKDSKGSLQQSDEHDSSNADSWSAFLARAVGMDFREQVKAKPTFPPHKGNAGGVGAFYYYTLHTAFTSLQIRLKKAQLVAGDVQTDVANLEEKVANLHDLLINQFSPRVNPYFISKSVTLPKTNFTSRRSKIQTENPASSIKTPTFSSQTITHPSNNDVPKSQTKPFPAAKATPSSKVPPNDIYARLYDQFKVKNSYVQAPIVSTRVPDEKIKVKTTVNPFQESRQLLSVIENNKHTVSSNVNSNRESQLNNTKITQTKHKLKLRKNADDLNSEIGLMDLKECEKTRRDSSTSSRNDYLSVTQEEMISSVSVLIIDRGQSSVDLRERMARLYPGITIHFITSSSDLSRPRHIHRLVLHHVAANATLSSAYKLALEYVSTPYVFVATNTSAVLSTTSLEHMVWATMHLGVWAVSGSLLSPSGRWHLGCVEVKSSHYQVTWTRRRLGTAGGCSLCHSLEGPFLAVTPALRFLGWDTRLPDTVSQLDLFLRASQNHHMMSAVCPQELFNIAHELVPPSRSSLLSLAKNHGFYSIQVPDEKQFKFTCEEVPINCGVFGFALPPCCRRELARLVRFLMDTCDAHGLLCELQEGTLLGATKMGAVMPWEKDADVTFLTNNFTALSELKDVFDRAGYSLRLVDNRWCCADGRWAGGQGTLSSYHWTLELYSQHAMDSEDELLARRPRTRVLFDGSWVTAPSSPGLYVRNRYGTELYRHAQHWLDTGRKSGWEDYEPGRFLPCPHPNHHACLDDRVADGSLGFEPLCLP